MEYRKMEKKFFTVKSYKKAEECRKIADKLEQEDKDRIDSQVSEKIEKEEAKIRHK